MSSRITQDIPIVVTQPSTAAVRESQDLSLVVSSPSTVSVRLSQDVQLVIISTVKQIRQGQQPNMSVIN
jgi:hypothetical protein